MSCIALSSKLGCIDVGGRANFVFFLAGVISLFIEI
jgi:hypothetical protein